MADINPTAPAAATAPLPPEDASLHLMNRISKRMDDLAVALHTSNFYIEIALVALALLAALLISRQLQAHIRRKIAVSPPKFIDSDIIIRPLPLLGPLASMLTVWVVQLIAIIFDIGGNFAGGILQLAWSYLLIRCVLLVVHARAVAYCISGAIIVNALLRTIKISKSTSAYLDSLAFDVGQYHISALHIMQGFVIFIVVFWGAGLLSRTLESYLRRSTKLSINARELTVKFFRIFVYVLAFVITLSAIGIDLTAFAVFSGALGVGVGLGLQKITANFVSGVTMLMEKSIKIGDLIEVGGNTGWVRQLNIRYALIETFDGKEILIPNEEFVSTRVINWTLTTTMARAEMKIVIDFDSDAEKARALMLEAARENPRCLKDPGPSCYLKEINGNGINFALAFWIADVKEGRNGPQSDVLFAILKKFQQNNIALSRVPGA